MRKRKRPSYDRHFRYFNAFTHFNGKIPKGWIKHYGVTNWHVGTSNNLWVNFSFGYRHIDIRAGIVVIGVFVLTILMSVIVTTICGSFMLGL